VNDVPPGQDPPEDVDDLYRRAAAIAPSRPSDAVRRAVQSYAAQLAATRAANKAPSDLGSRRPAANQAWRRPAAFGTLAAAALAGLLMTPHFFTPRPKVTTAASSAKISRPEAGAAPAPMSVIESSRQHDVSAETSNAAAKPHVSPPTVAPRPVLSYAPPNQNAPTATLGAPDEAPPIAAQNSRARAQSMADARDAGAAPSRQPALPPPRTALSSDPAAALRRAAEIGDLAALRTLLDAKAQVDARDASGRTALMLATLNGQTPAVATLLAHGADPNAADAYGTTPLQAAVAGDQPAIAATLRRAGAR
jgi:hypothetical protein